MGLCTRIPVGRWTGFRVIRAVAVYERTSVVDAPLEEVWEFHATIDGLRALTPGWFGVTVEAVVGSDGTVDRPELVPGTEIRMVARPVGFFPAGVWIARITDREFGPEAAWFRDVMVEGPLARWTHTHRFEALGDRTLVHDRIEYALPLGPLRGLSPVARPLLAALFAYRHRRTEALFE